MHIIQLANYFGPRSGGLRVALLELRARYVAAGHRVTTIVPGPHDSSEASNGAITLTCKAPALPASGGYHVFLGRRQLSDLLTSLRPDLIELSDKSTLHWVPEWATQQGIPCALISHERIDAVLARRLPRFVPLAQLSDRWNRRMARDVGLVIGASCFALEEYLRIDHPKLVRVPLGFDRSVFTPEARGAASPRWPEGPAQLVAVTRLSREKNPGLAVETVGALMDMGAAARLTVIGDGPERARLERRARGMDITFLGHLADRHLLARLVSGADVALAPGPAETFGLAALEALACGTPIVVPSQGALAELVGRGCGVVAEPDAQSFAEAVITLLRGNRAEQRRATVRHAAQFSWDTAADRLLWEYGRMVTGEERACHRAPL